MSMPEPLSLQLIARLVCVQSLLDLTEGKDVTNFLKTVCHGAVTEDILSHMVKFYPRKLTNEMLAGLASPHIHQLKLANCTQIKPSNFIKIFPHCKHLCGLDLKQCNQLMLGDFFVLMDRMGVNLTSISVEECTTVDDDIVHSILQNLHHLKHLNVSSCKNITDKAFLISQDQLKKRNLLK
ncbi:F-box/LRR-repeat protein 15-like, partial [Saccostrea cucullata]|uniref:F-box/LRR-repeat protein 15-like n=1 Tax=Saccostrea cuccullata TaxID=36930 RepID=UPI002ED0BA5B